MLIAAWRRAPTKHEAWYADLHGWRMFVQLAVRSRRPHPEIKPEFESLVCGIRVGDFETVAEAQEAAERAVLQR